MFSETNVQIADILISKRWQSAQLLTANRQLIPICHEHVGCIRTCGNLQQSIN